MIKPRGLLKSNNIIVEMNFYHTRKSYLYKLCLRNNVREILKLQSLKYMYTAIFLVQYYYFIFQQVRLEKITFWYEISAFFYLVGGWFASMTVSGPIA